MQTFPCPLCQKPLQIQETKKRKPYLMCEEDGMQMFVRFEEGIRRFKEVVKHGVTLSEDFVICNRCEIAVKRSKKNITLPWIGQKGIYCPACEQLLLAVA